MAKLPTTLFMNAKQTKIMNNEIKQGDKVRIANNAPSEYRYGFNYRLRTQENEVVELDDDGYMAAIVPMCVNDKDLWFQIPIKYLIKVDAEAKEAKFKVGDRVCVKGCGYEPNLHKGDIGEILDTNDKEQCFVLFKKSQAWIYADCLEPYTEPTTPTIKAGVRVRNIESGLIGVVDKIVYGNIAWVNGVDGKRYHWKSDELELIKPTEQTHQRATIISEGDIHSLDETSTNKIGSISIPVEVDLTDSYWDAYTAELAREIAIESMEKSYGCDPERIADYAVSVAKAVVEGLKRK